ncbi:MAG: restriction endonuclease subunit S [Nitrospira sp.]|nr:restriction endonuclease subunit S [Nitrospira sp.]MDH4243665.1 restriction endonuclease subunit S [Nitrospira sp.]MDH4357441.1 restriction endonuclease subunit S [Nitrospira sp.]MDH5316928.1 restriction endonuclease subunit S [Nitrospira sp.]
MMNTRRLDAVSNIMMGQAPEGESYNLDGEGLPLIAGAGGFGELHPEPKKFTTAPGKTCQAGDIMLGIRATIGEKVLADGTYCLGRGVAGLRAKSGLDERYLWHWLTDAAPSLAAKAKGATFKQVNREDIGELRIALPPLPEQRRIAAIPDKADELRAKRRAALSKLDSLTQSIFLDMFGDPATNPKGWLRESLTSACHCYSGGTPAKEIPGNWTGSLPWFSPKDLKQHDLFDSEDHINESIPSTTSLKLLPADTVAIVVRGMILAHTFPVSVLRVPATVNQDLKALLPREPIDAQFLAHCLRAQSSRALGQVSESAHGTKRLDADAAG